MGFLCYSPTKLKSIRHNVTTSIKALPLTTWQKLQQHGISALPQDSSTTDQKPIKVIARSRKHTTSTKYGTGVNHKNLALVPTDIQPIVGVRPNHHAYAQNRANLANLVSIAPIGNNEKNSSSHKSIKGNLLNCCLWNCQSAKNKTTAIHDYAVDNHIDIMGLTETWLGDQDQVTIGEICPPGYKFQHVPRPGGKYGGVGILYKSNIEVKLEKSAQCQSFEHIVMKFTLANENIRIMTVYRPPPSKKNKLNSGMFFAEFPDLLDRHLFTNGNLLIWGDFNFHPDDITHPDTPRLNQMMASSNLDCHIFEETHKKGHTLDLVLTRGDENCVKNIRVVKNAISDHDHHIVHLDVSYEKPELQTKTINYRKIKSIDHAQLKHDIAKSELCKNPASGSVLDLVAQYNTVLNELLEKHAPERSKTITIRPLAPWYNQAIALEKKERRKAECKWRSTKLEVHREAYKHQKKKVNTMIDQAKCSYYQTLVKENSSNPKELFKIANTLLNNTNERPLPNHQSAEELANRFADYFVEKISKIQSDLDSLRDSSAKISENVPHFKQKLNDFDPATEEEIRKLIMASASKTCGLDPIPTGLLKDCLDPLLSTITQIVNLSFSTTVMPENMKDAIVGPLLKKLSLDPDILKNFRPVSNLSFISKLVEKIVSIRFLNHLKINNLHEVLQSAYKQGHSTETALIRVQNDILQSIDEQKCVLLVLLDLSAAFDTVNHQVLLTRLEERFGISGNALAWVKSYMSNRTQKVNIGGSTSASHILDCGVPQGSVLGPLFFIAYTGPLGDILRRHNISFHLYADDTQLYLAFKPDVTMDAEKKREAMEQCIIEVGKWMAQNFLKQNDDKTEFIIIGTKAQLKKVKISTIKIGNTNISSSTSVRNIGALFDNIFSLVPHINQTCRAARFHLRNLGKIRKYMDYESTTMLIHAFITSRLDNLNGLLHGLPSNQISKLQKIQNMAARLLTRKAKYDHITETLKDLHWLPVVFRIQFKLLLLTYRALNDEGPGYIKDLLKLYQPERNLRSKNQLRLQEPASHLRTYGDRCFANAAPRLWNELPLTIRQSSTTSMFKTTLKTYLFKKAYS
jgi:hypothetical protein